MSQYTDYKQGMEIKSGMEFIGGKDTVLKLLDDLPKFSSDVQYEIAHIYKNIYTVKVKNF